MGIHIWKRFGPRSAFQYLNLSGVYSVGTKAKKKQQVFLKGGLGTFTNRTLVRRKNWTISNSTMWGIQVHGRSFMVALRTLGGSDGQPKPCLQ